MNYTKKDILILNNSNNDIIESDNSTGLVITDSYVAHSGFNYIYGVRKFGNLNIIESVAKGIGISYLTSVRVQNENGELIIDHSLEKGVKYSRETVRVIVLNELLGILKEATLNQNLEFNEEDARVMINIKLKIAYYKKSYEAALIWGNSLGIKFKKNNTK